MDLSGDVVTARLHGRPPQRSDLEALTAIWTDPRIDDDHWPAELRTADDADRVLLATIAHWERWGFGAWTVIERSSAEIVGRVGLGHTRVTGSPSVEIAWFLSPDVWGRGYATEMALEAVRLAFGPLELDEIIGLVLPGNAPSIAVMLRCGLRYAGAAEHAGLTHSLFRLARADRPPG